MRLFICVLKLPNLGIFVTALTALEVDELKRFSEASQANGVAQRSAS